MWHDRDGTRTSALVAFEPGNWDSRCLVLSPDGKKIFAAATDAICVWDTQSFARIATWEMDSSSIAISSDGKVLFTCSDARISVLDVANGEVIESLEEVGSAAYTHLLLSPNGEFLVALDDENTIRLWETSPSSSSHKCIATLQGKGFAFDRCLAITSDSKTLLMGTRNSKHNFWDLPSKSPLSVWEPPGDEIDVSSVDMMCVAFSPDDKHFLSGWSDCNIRMFETRSRRLSALLVGHDNAVTALAFLGKDYDERRRITLISSCGKSIRLWDIEYRQCLTVLRGDTSDTVSFVVPKMRNSFYTFNNQGDVHLWDLTVGENSVVLEDRMEIASRSFVRVRSLVFLPVEAVEAFSDGSTEIPKPGTLFTGYDDGTIGVWRVHRNGELSFLRSLERRHTDAVLSLVFTSHAMLISSSKDNTVRVWNISAQAETSTCRAVFQGHLDSVCCMMEVLAYGVIVSGCHDGMLCIWNIEAVQSNTNDNNDVYEDDIEMEASEVLHGHEDAVLSVAATSYCRDTLVYSASADSCIRVWSMETKECTEILHGHNDAVTSIALLKRDEVLVSSSCDGMILLWHATGKEHKSYATLQQRHREGSLTMMLPYAYHPFYEEKYYQDSVFKQNIIFAVEGDPVRIQMWDVEAKEIIATFCMDDRDEVAAIALSPDGETLVSVLTNGTTQTWSMSTSIRHNGERCNPCLRFPLSPLTINDLFLSDLEEAKENPHYEWPRFKSIQPETLTFALLTDADGDELVPSLQERKNLLHPRDATYMNPLFHAVSKGDVAAPFLRLMLRSGPKEALFVKHRVPKAILGTEDMQVGSSEELGLLQLALKLNHKGHVKVILGKLVELMLVRDGMAATARSDFATYGEQAGLLVQETEPVTCGSDVAPTAHDTRRIVSEEADPIDTVISQTLEKFPSLATDVLAASCATAEKAAKNISLALSILETSPDVDFDFLHSCLLQPATTKKIQESTVLSQLARVRGASRLLDVLVLKMPDIATTLLISYLSQGLQAGALRLLRRAQGEREGGEKEGIFIDFEVLDEWLQTGIQEQRLYQVALLGGDVVCAIVHSLPHHATDFLCACLRLMDIPTSLQLLKNRNDNLSFDTSHLILSLNLILDESKGLFWSRMLVVHEGGVARWNNGMELFKELCTVIPTLAHDVVCSGLMAPLRGLHKATVETLDTDPNQSSAFSSIAVAPNGAMFCVPSREDCEVLTIQPFESHGEDPFSSNRFSRTIKLPVQSVLTSNDLWDGIASGPDGKLYCAPLNAMEVLVIDPSLGHCTTIDCGDLATGTSNKWRGIATSRRNSKLYCAPFEAPVVLVVDPASGTCSSIECSVKGSWWGIAEAQDGMLYCAPHGASVVLVIDPVEDKCSTIDFDVPSEGNWSGVAAASNGKLYCAPNFEASAVLVVDPALKKCTTIEYELPVLEELRPSFQEPSWVGITMGDDGRLYCAPQTSNDLLVIDPCRDTCIVSKLKADRDGQEVGLAWSGIAWGADGKLYGPDGMFCVQPSLGSVTDLVSKVIQPLEKDPSINLVEIDDLLTTPTEFGPDEKATPWSRLAILDGAEPLVQWCLEKMPTLAPAAFMAAFHCEREKDSYPLLHRYVDIALREVNKASMEELLLQIYGDNEDEMTTAWHHMVTTEACDQVVFKISRAFPSLHRMKDPNGRSAYVLAKPKCRNQINNAVLFCGKYRLHEKLHQSLTCIVVLAQLVGQVQTSPQKLEIIARLPGEESGEDPWVVIKFMVNNDMYNREIAERFGLDSEFIVPVQDSSEKISTWSEQVAGLDLNGGPYPFGIVMPAANRNLMVVLLQERLTFDAACRVQMQLANALNHMHEQNKLHGDFKPLNVVRMADNTWHLIDFDATVCMGSPVGAKTSSAYCPPEMTTFAEQIDVKKQVRVITSEQALQCVPRTNSDEVVEADIVLRRHMGRGTAEDPYKLVDDQYKELEDSYYDLIYAEKSFDLWSYGVVLYRTLTRKALLQADASDNLINPLELRRLHTWSFHDVDLVMHEVDFALRFEFTEVDELQRLAATEIVGWLLQPQPSKRPASFSELLDHSFFKPFREETKCVKDRTRSEWRMSPLHCAAATGSVAIFSTPITAPNINSTRHILGKTPIHLAAQYGQVEVVDAILRQEHCDVSVRDLLGNTAVHAVLAEVLRAADRRDHEAVGKLRAVLELFLANRRSAFNDKVGERGVTAFDIGRTCKVKKVRDLFRGLHTVLSAIQSHDKFNVDDFNFQWDFGNAQNILEDAVFGLLQEWAFDTKDGTSIESKRPFLQDFVFPLKMWDRQTGIGTVKTDAANLGLFQKMKLIAQKRMESVLKNLFAIRDDMVRGSEGGRLIQELSSIKGPDLRMEIPVADDCAAAGGGSESMKGKVDVEVLVPLVAATASELLSGFTNKLQSALVGDTIFIQGGANHEKILENNPKWVRWCKVAPVKGITRTREKVKECRKECKGEWPYTSQLGDVLRAMVVCRGGPTAGDTIYRTWRQLEAAFDIREGRGRLKNNFATAGVPHDDPKVFQKNQKPPDMLMNVMLELQGAMPIVAEIQVHHEEILSLKESNVHLLYEIVRAESIEALRGKTHKRVDQQVLEGQLAAQDQRVETSSVPIPSKDSNERHEALQLELQQMKEQLQEVRDELEKKDLQLRATKATSKEADEERPSKESLDYVKELQLQTMSASLKDKDAQLVEVQAQLQEKVKQLEAFQGLQVQDSSVE